MACLVFVPWAAFLLAAAAFSGSVICFVLLPREVKVSLKDAMFGPKVSPSRKIANFAMILGGIALAMVAFIDRLQ